MAPQASRPVPSPGLEPVTCHITTHRPDTRLSTLCPPTVVEPTAVGPQACFSYLYSVAEPWPNLDTEQDLVAARALAGTPAALRLVQPNGSVFRAVDLAPGSPPHFHRSQSLDYVVVTAGEIELTMEDDTRAVCTAGDVVVQRGTMHAWRNRSTEKWARMVVVMIESKPLVVNGVALAQDMGQRPDRATERTQPQSAVSQLLTVLKSSVLFLSRIVIV